MEMKFKLCCGGKKCPIVKVNGDNVEITDDYGGRIFMSLDQLKELPKHLDELTG